MIGIAQESVIAATPVRLRPYRGNWILVILCDIALVFALTPGLLGKRPANAPDYWAAMVFLVSFSLVPTLLFGYWQARAMIIADEDGLRWRGFGRWHIARWPDVSDYYERFIAKTKPALIVETNSGRLCLNSGLWTATPEWRMFIEQKATQARVKEWGIFGMRPEVDWPRTFGYNTPNNRFQSISLLVLVVIVIPPLLWISPSAVRSANGLGWGWGLATFGMFIFGSLPSGLLLAVSFRLQRATRRRKHQRITLARDGVLYEDEHGKREAPWGDISDLHFARGKELGYNCVIVSKQGTFDFSRYIKEYSVLKRAFPQFATALPEAKWRTTESDMLGGMASRRDDGREGMGRRIYHYRTRTNRALLFLATFPTFTLLLSVLLMQWIGGGVEGSPSFAYGLTSSLGVPALLGIWRYAAAGIETDEDGIRQRTLFGMRYLAWDDVSDYGTSGGDVFVFGVVKGAKSRLWFWMGIGDVEELKAEIQWKALDSRRRAWDEQEENIG